MTLVLDSGGVSMLAGHRARIQEVRRRGEWPRWSPPPSWRRLSPAITGETSTRIDLRVCIIEPVEEDLARDAALLRTAAAGSRIPSAVDAIVVAQADRVGGAVVLTTDPGDLRALARHTKNLIRVSTG